MANPGFGGFGSTGGGLFGAPKPADASKPPAFGGFGAPVGSSLFGTTAPPASGGLFGVPPAAGSTPAGGAPSGSSLFGTAAPAAPAAGGLFGAPAGGPAPASGAAPGGSNLFGAPGGGSLFGAAPASSTPAAGAAPAAPTLGGGGFGGFGTKPAAAAPANPLFGGGAATPAAAPAAGAAPGSLFGGGIFGAKPDAAKPTAGATPAATAPVAGGLFGSTTTPAGAAGAAPSAGGFFGTTPAAPSGPAASAPAAAGAATTTPAAPGTTATGNPLFGGPSAGLGAGLFGPKPPASATPAPGPAAAATPAPSAAPASVTPISGAATAGPPPVASAPAPSLLRGKTMEEIVNRWNQELEAQTREFAKYANDIAGWDRTLIDNNNFISTLHATVLEAEAKQGAVDQALDQIEAQQKELAATLDVYENDAKTILEGQGGGLRALEQGPADAERDRNYTLAGSLHAQLDELSKSLVQMIDSVNVLEPKPGAGAAALDDPMNTITNVLDQHLSSLAWIDQNVREVETKVCDIGKKIDEQSGNPGPRAAPGGSGFTASASRSRGFGLR